MGLSFIVENKTGANGAIGAAAYLLDDFTAGTPWSGFNAAFYLAAGFVAGAWWRATRTDR